MAKSAKEFIAGLRHKFCTHACPENARHMKDYTRGQFEYYGIKSPARRQLVQEHVADVGLPEAKVLKEVVDQLWGEPNREMQYAAMELLFEREKELTLADIPALERMVTTKSWWDTVDFISYKLVGRLLARHPDQEAAVARRMSASGNLWLVRVSLLFQLLRKRRTDEELLAELILRQADHKDFFIRKAVGWALRDYARTAPAWVRSFVKENSNLSPLSVREALKNL